MVLPNLSQVSDDELLYQKEKVQQIAAWHVEDAERDARDRIAEVHFWLAEEIASISEDYSNNVLEIDREIEWRKHPHCQARRHNSWEPYNEQA